MYCILVADDTFHLLISELKLLTEENQLKVVTEDTSHSLTFTCLSLEKYTLPNIPPISVTEDTSHAFRF